MFLYNKSEWQRSKWTPTMKFSKTNKGYCTYLQWEPFFVSCSWATAVTLGDYAKKCTTQNKYTSIQTAIANSWFSNFLNSIVPKCEEDILFTFQNLFIRSFRVFCPRCSVIFLFVRHPRGYFKRLTALSCIRWQSSKVCVVVSVSQSGTDSECVYIQ